MGQLDPGIGKVCQGIVSTAVARPREILSKNYVNPWSVTFGSQEKGFESPVKFEGYLIDQKTSKKDNYYNLVIDNCILSTGLWPTHLSSNV